jgi:hypothetical protein
MNEKIINLEDADFIEIAKAVILNPGYIVTHLQTRHDWLTVWRDNRVYEGKCEPWQKPIDLIDELTPEEDDNGFYNVIRSVTTALNTVPAGNIEDMGGLKGLIKAFEIVEACAGYVAYGHTQSEWREFFPAKEHSKSDPIPVNQYTKGEEFVGLDFKKVRYITRTPLAGGGCVESFFADTIVGADWTFSPRGKIFPPKGTRLVVETGTGDNKVTRAYQII